MILTLKWDSFSREKELVEMPSKELPFAFIERHFCLYFICICTSAYMNDLCKFTTSLYEVQPGGNK